MKKLLLIIPLFLIGCTPYDAPEVRSLNKDRLSQDGEYIGTLKDGRVISRYWINNGDDMHTHFIYIISDKSSITVNTRIQVGKTSHNEAVMVINGKEYVEKEN